MNDDDELIFPEPERRTIGKVVPVEELAALHATIERLTQERDKADNALQAISRTLGGTDEWTDQGTMIASVKAQTEAIAAELAKAREALADVRRWTLFELQYGAGREPWPARLAKIDAALAAKPETEGK